MVAGIYPSLIVPTCYIKNKQIYYHLLLQETVKLHQLLTFFQVNLEACIKDFQKYFCTVV